MRGAKPLPFSVSVRRRFAAWTRLTNEPKSVSWTVDIVLPDGSLNLYALVHGG
jgi:hypothetical protein